MQMTARKKCGKIVNTSGASGEPESEREAEAGCVCKQMQCSEPGTMRVRLCLSDNFPYERASGVDAESLL